MPNFDFRNSPKPKQRHYTHTPSPVPEEPEPRFRTLSPTPSTSSVDVYRMTNRGNYIAESDNISSDGAPEAGPSGNNVDNNEVMEIMAPDYHDAIHGLIEQGSPEFRATIQTLFAASNPDQGATAYDCHNLLNPCSHCGCLFTPKAYKAHILANF